MAAAKDGVVYLMRNKHNGKVYVGSTQEYEIRKTSHFRPSYIQSDIEFNNDKRKYGKDGFEFEVLLEMKFFDKKELWQVEDAYIAIHNSIQNGYNTRYNTFRLQDDPEYRREYREKNTHNIKAKKREYYEKNKDTLKAKRCEHYEENKEAINAKRCEHRQQNKDQFQARDREYYEKNKDDILAKQRERYEQNKDDILAKRRERYERKKQEKQWK